MLPLDNLNLLKCSLEQNGFETHESVYDDSLEFSDNGSARVHAQHVVLPLQALLLTARAVYLHVVRGFASIISGIASWDERKILGGAKDLLALFIEVLVLPILAVVALFTPALVYKIVKTLETKEIDAQRDDLERVKEEAVYEKCEPFRKEVTSTIRGLFAPLIGIPDTFIMGLVILLSGNPRDAFKISTNEAIGGVLGPVLGVASHFSETANELVYSVHAIKA